MLCLFFNLKMIYAQSVVDTPIWKAQWIESQLQENDISRPAQYFRTVFVAKKKVKKAIAYITSHGMYEAQLNGNRTGDIYLAPGWTSYDKRQQYQSYDVTNLLKQGKNSIGVIVGNGWHRSALAWGDNRNRWAKKLGLLFQMEIEFTDGTKQVVGSGIGWKSSNGAIQANEIYYGENIDARLEKKGWALP